MINIIKNVVTRISLHTCGIRIIGLQYTCGYIPFTEINMIVILCTIMSLIKILAEMLDLHNISGMTYRESSKLLQHFKRNSTTLITTHVVYSSSVKKPNEALTMGASVVHSSSVKKPNEAPTMGASVVH